MKIAFDMTDLMTNKKQKIIDNIEAQSRSLLKNGWKRVREKYEGHISLEKSLSKN